LAGLATKACVGIDKGARGKGEGGLTKRRKKREYTYTDRKRFSYLRRGI
jgi:hypothetical protein